MYFTFSTVLVERRRVFCVLCTCHLTRYHPYGRLRLRSRNFSQVKSTVPSRTVKLTAKTPGALTNRKRNLKAREYPRLIHETMMYRILNVLVRSTKSATLIYLFCSSIPRLFSPRQFFITLSLPSAIIDSWNRPV